MMATATATTEHRPVVWTAREQAMRNEFTAMGFVIACRPFQNADDAPAYHCTRMVAGVEGDFSLNLNTGQLHRWGTGESWTLAEARREFGQPKRPVPAVPAAPAAPAATSVVTAAAAELPPGSHSAMPDSPDPLFVSQCRAAGFAQLRISAAVSGLQPKWFAVYTDGSRWLLDPNTELCLCLSEAPVTGWKLLRAGSTWRLVHSETNALRAVAATQPPAADSSRDAAQPVQSATVPRRRQTTLF